MNAPRDPQRLGRGRTGCRPSCVARRRGARPRVPGVLAGLLTLSLTVAAQQSRLEIEQRAGESWVRLSSDAGVGPSVHALEGSVDFEHWSVLAQTHDRFAGYPDLEGEAPAARFYHVRERPRTDLDDWRHQAWYFEDPFRSPDPGWRRTSWGTACSTGCKGI